MKILLPEQLKKVADNQSELIVNGSTVKEVLDALVFSYPGIKERLFKPEGGLNRFVNVFVNDEDIRFLGDLGTPVYDADVITIIPAIAGG